MSVDTQVSEWLKLTGGVPLPDIADWARLNGRDAVVDHLGDAFLFLKAPLVGGRIRSTLFQTVDDVKKRASEEPPLSQGRIFFVRPTGRSGFPDFVSVGRIQNNDIVLDDASVTKFHAFFRMENGKLGLCDAGSSNGTTANGKKVPKKGDGVIVPTNKMVLRFGSVELVFVDAGGLCELALRV